MSTLIRAIITGFGIKLGQDIYRVVNRKLGVFPEDDAAQRTDDDDDDEIEEVARFSRILGGS